MLDPAQAALLVRVTARISAVLFATSLVAAARRVGVRNPGAVRSARRGDLAAFGLWVAAHSIHFAAVALLARATAGQNIRDAGGYAGTLAVGLTFYVACGAVFRVKARPAAAWTAAAERRVETWTAIVVWIVFFQAYALRLTQSPLFAVLALVLAAALAAFLMRARAPISSNMQRPSVGVS
ncbi:MAG TPA: hypothetical protein VKE51_00705 [Vicinamibacterales bacterium]|nr:hypothetical protein [Vicinamibacterales bacterium]